VWVTSGARFVEDVLVAKAGGCCCCGSAGGGGGAGGPPDDFPFGDSKGAEEVGASLANIDGGFFNASLHFSISTLKFSASSSEEKLKPQIPFES